MTLDRRIAFGMTLQASTLDRIDQERGDIPRARYIEEAMIRGMNKERGPRKGYRTPRGSN